MDSGFAKIKKKTIILCIELVILLTLLATSLDKIVIIASSTMPDLGWRIVGGVLSLEMTLFLLVLVVAISFLGGIFTIIWIHEKLKNRILEGIFTMILGVILGISLLFVFFFLRSVFRIPTSVS